MREDGKTASCNDSKFFQGTDATVGDAFAPLGESHGKRTNRQTNKIRTSGLLDQSGPRGDSVKTCYDSVDKKKLYGLFDSGKP